MSPSIYYKECPHCKTKLHGPRGRPRKVDDDIAAAIRTQRAAGDSYDKISKDVELPLTTVFNVVNGNGYKRKHEDIVT